MQSTDHRVLDIFLFIVIVHLYVKQNQRRGKKVSVIRGRVSLLRFDDDLLPFGFYNFTKFKVNRTTKYIFR